MPAIKLALSMALNVFRIKYRKKHSYSYERIANPSAINKDNAQHYHSHTKHERVEIRWIFRLFNLTPKIIIV
jgi:hypothetical protein